MELFLQQISASFLLNLPENWADWCLFCLWAIALVVLIYRFSQKLELVKKNPLDWFFYILLTIICSSLFRIDLFPFHIQIFPSTSQAGSDFFLILFQAIPWIAAAVFEKRMLSITLALIGSLVFSGFFGHNIFFVLLILSVALLFNYFLYEKTGILAKFRQHPLVILGSVVVCVLPLFYLEHFTGSSTELAVRLDACFHDGWSYYLSRILELMIAGLVAEILVREKGEKGNQETPVISSTGKKKITLHLMGLFYLTLFILTILWNITRANALAQWKNEIEERMSSINVAVMSNFTSNAIRIDQLSKEILLNGNSAEIREQIKPLFQPIQNLDEFYLFDPQGALIFSYPYIQEEELIISNQEIRSFQNVLQGNSIQAAFSSNAPSNLLMSILYPVPEDDQTIKGVVIGRIDIQNNPAFLPLATVIQSYQSEGLQIAFVNTMLDARVAWMETASEESSNLDTATSLYSAMGLEGWGIEMSLNKQAFLADFFRDFLPYFLTTLACTVAIGGFYFTRWASLEKAIANLSSRFSSEDFGNTESERGESLPRIILDFLDILKNVFQKLDKRFQETQTFLDLWRSYDDQVAFHSLVEKALKIFADDDTLFVKVLVEKRLGDTIPEKYMLSFIENPDDFDYLDEQIIKIIEEQDQLVIGNTSRFHQLTRAIGKPFPQALIITKFPMDQERKAILEIAYRSTHEFSKDFMESFTQKVEIFYEQLAAIDKLQQWLLEKKILSKLFDSLNFPLFIFVNKELLYGNKAGSTFLKMDDSEEYTSIEKRVQENEIYNLMLKNVAQEKTVLTKEMPSGEKYEIDILNSDDPGIGQVSVLFLKDITREKKREEITRDFVTMLSHDLRSPITVMQGYSKMLPMVGELNATQQDYLDKIKNGLETITTLVEGILIEDRIENGMDLSCDEINISNMIQEIITQLESLANQKRVKINSSTIAPATTIQGDAVLLKQAFYNLIHNAVKFSEMDGSIEINSTENDDDIEIEITDSGPGIAAIDIPFIFEKYYHPKGSGNISEKQGGMGLYIAKFIIDAHRGNISVESELGKGAIFRINLPKINPTK
ncbi:MAG: sensor histidine kinase [Anaerolineaceae bacterium]|nr:MAG: sensor histidine kinase [Anaerolineaceae bacterium]